MAGAVSGLVGSGLLLHLAGGTDVAIATNGGFSFPATLASGNTYAVSVARQPATPAQLCTVANGSGTIAGAVTNIAVTCASSVYIAINPSQAASSFRSAGIDELTPSGTRYLAAGGYESTAGFVLDRNGRLHSYVGSIVRQLSADGTWQNIANFGPDTIQGLAFDEAGAPYAALASGAIVRQARNGQTAVWATGLDNPGALGFDRSGNLFVLTRASAGTSIVRFSAAGARTVFASSGIARSSLAVDSAGNVYVIDTGNGVTRFLPDGTATTFLPAGAMTCGASPYVAARLFTEALAIDPADNVYVSNSGMTSFFSLCGRVDRFSSAGVRTGGTPPVSGGQPIAIDSSSTLYGITAFRADSSGSSAAPVLGTSDTFSSGPIAVDDAGNLYIADTGAAGKIIEKITPSGVRSVFAASGLRAPADIEADAQGNLFVADAEDRTVRKFNPAGQSTLFCTLTDQPVDIALDGSGNVYVATRAQVTTGGVVTMIANVLKFAADGSGGTPFMPPLTVGAPARIVVGADGTLYEATSDYFGTSPLNGYVWKKPPGGVAQLFYSGTQFPVGGLVIDGGGDLVVNSGAGGQPLRRISPAGVAKLMTEYEVLYSTLAADRSGNLYASSDGMIRRLGAGGTVTVTVIDAVPGPSYTGIALDGSRNLYAAHGGSNAHLTKFRLDGQGTLVTTRGAGAVVAAARMQSPAGVAVDKSGNVYIANTTANTISRMTLSGSTSLFVESGLNLPTGLAVDAAGNLYAANRGDNTIKRFTPDGVGSVFGSALINAPEQIATDDAGNLYVANSGDGTVVRFRSDGSAAVIGRFSGESAIGVAVDTLGNVFVSTGAAIRRIAGSTVTILSTTGGGYLATPH